MVNDLTQLFLERVSGGLKRKALTRPSQWCQQYRVMGPPFPGLWTFKHHPWTLAPHDSNAEFNISQKAAQMGFTELGLNITFSNIDLHQRSVLYILPATTPDATDFSASRFDPAIELSEHLQHLFSNVKNVGHKRAGAANLFIRGSRSKSGLISIPCPIIIFDELDKMTQENIPLAYERASGQLFKQFWKISTPTVDGFGINKFFNDSTQEHFFFKCPCCGKSTELIYPDCLVINEEQLDLTHLICKECKGILPHETKSEWLNNNCEYVAAYPKKVNRGWWVPQLYSMTVHPKEIAKTVIKARFDPAEEQELWNSKLGLPHIREGARLNDKQINDCIDNYYQGPESGLITMGIDVGTWLHFEINSWKLTEGFVSDINMRSHCKLLKEGKVASFDELDSLMREYQVLMAVIDANPERRKAMEFAQRFWGHVYLCFYSRGLVGKKDLSVTDNCKVSVDRTSWMDTALSRFGSKRISLPINISEDYKTMIKIPARIYEKDQDGNPIGRYVGEGDHAAHARTYSELALPFAASVQTNANLQSFL